ncbi:uncharacterized protein JN550_006715 [Neoarthrinium moseri]|uniref:uncharacterized protein n=1 Tax=Neoarthrinium moseri TaxID=1658444 RepID=UPI001FDB1EBA|nr:uncharacterized protein JN550_006715 [Neoarthrinium moseri]KAI1867908.1 hypothetical protein JN550_006715 [Neoarthrinium moseri]
MAPKKQDRDYDVVLLGATGYTGLLTAEHIVEHLPTSLRWAIAGRSRTKLDALASRLKKLGPDKIQPAIEVVSVEDQDQLDAVVRKAKVCLSVVLYFSVGRHVVRACVENGTDYLDVTGNIAELYSWIEDYHEKAKANNVALIHACGAFSAPHDLLAWAAARELKKATSSDTSEAVLSVKKITMSPSGGTVESIMSKSTVDPKTQEDARGPWSLSPLKGVTATVPTNIFGVRHVPHLGLLANSCFGLAQDRAIVHRTWGLLGGEYGPNFKYTEYESVGSTLGGVAKILSGFLLGVALSFKPTLPLVRRFLPAQGDGPDTEKTKLQDVELEAVALADTQQPEGQGKNGFARLSYKGDTYHLTGALLAQGAASLLYKREFEGGLRAGCLTPAILGDDFLDRLRGVGLSFEASIV